MLTEHDFTYCPKCGNQFAKRWSNLLVCGRCDLHYYINPRPTNAVIFENEKGEILCIKRKWPPKKGFWDLPGGFVDLNETMEESVRREVREELGIVIEGFTYFGSYHNPYIFKGLKFYTLASVFTSQLPSSTRLEAGDDAGSVSWIAKGKIPYEKIAFSGMTSALKDYLKK